jgi:beta-galactosidase/beta-glucuronidase
VTNTIHSTTLRLDGDGWSMAIDPKNEGRAQKWYDTRPAASQPTQVPGVMQRHFPDYHGVAWYWRDFTAPANPHAGGRYLLRFHAVDYLAEVWVNGIRIGLHEGSEEPFALDATGAIKPDAHNLLAVRVLNPTDVAIDGICMKDVALGRRQNATPSDAACNTGGIIDSVECCVVPAARIADLHVMPDWKTGGLRVRVTARNAGDHPVRGILRVTVAPAIGGESVAADACEKDFTVGDTGVEVQLQVPSHRLWELNNPYLYRVTASVQAGDQPSVDESSVRCGFRDFRFENGYFRLNGRRIRLHGSLYVILHYPGSMSVPYDEELIRRDVLNLKMMGFNIVRICCGAALPARQLDIFDEMGLLAMEEHLGADPHRSGQQISGARWDNSIAGVIRRDRNHPCIVMWSLLNEVQDGTLFRNAVKSLEWIRDLDDSRIVLLNSGRFDGDASIGSWSSPNSRVWEKSELRDIHSYPNFPHTADTIRGMRGLDAMGGYLEKNVTSGDQRPVLLSEYGVCGAEDYPRFLRHFEQLGMEHSTDAKIYRWKLDQFMSGWRKWRLEECWARPEDYFRDSQRNMAKLVLDDYNAWSANPRLIGSFSSTQIIDAWFHGCGVFNYFRELKPGMADVYTDMSAKVRWNLFVEPVNVYRGTTVKFEAVLTNLDVLRPGKYPVRVQVVDPKLNRVYDEQVTVEIPDGAQGVEAPFAQSVFSRDVMIDGPSGPYRFLVDFERGAAASGGDIGFFVADRADMPAVLREIVLWGEDAELERWLTVSGIAWRRFRDASPDQRQVILVSGTPPAPGGPEVFAELARRIAMGTSVVFLTVETLKDVGAKSDTLRWAPFSAAERPSLASTPTWYFRADHWAKNHPIFEGLPSGGVMDYRFYREIIDGKVIEGVTSVDEAVCGTVYTSAENPSSALITSVHLLGAGRFILNTLRIRENLGRVPAAERLLRNMLNYAAKGTTEPVRALPVGFNEQLAKGLMFGEAG